MKTLLDREINFNEDICKLCDYARSQGFKPVFKECLRPIEMAALFKTKGLSWLSDPGKDKHVVGLAMDICFFRGINWCQDYLFLSLLGKYWCNLRAGNVWGGFWSVRDMMHFQAA